MANSRIFYAMHGVRLQGPSGMPGSTPKNTGYDRIQGLQSVGLTTNFSLNPIYQMGQLELYDNYEEVPEIEISLTKVLDGHPLIYTMAVGSGSLINAANNRCGVQLGIFTDKNSATTGTPQQICQLTPAYLSTVTYTFGVDDNFTEAATLVSNDKSWIAPASWGGYGTTDGDSFNRDPEGFGIARRQQMNMHGVNGGTVLPTGGTDGFATTSADGGTITADMTKTTEGGIINGAHIQSISITANLGREQIKELGSRTPFIRYVNFPAEITCEIQTSAVSGDNIGFAASAACANPKALGNKAIKIVLCDGTTFDLGRRNKLTSVAYAGGDTGGGNATLTYSYQTFNDFYHIPGTGNPSNDRRDPNIIEDTLDNTVINP